jgi:hypothetical protein
LKSSQDEFQRKIDESFEGLDGVVAIVDDILVFGHTREEHDKNLRSVAKCTSLTSNFLNGLVISDKFGANLDR